MQFTCIDLDMRTPLSGSPRDLSLGFFPEFFRRGHGSPSLQLVLKQQLISKISTTLASRRTLSTFV